MVEQLQPDDEYCEVYGNTDIKTSLGKLNVNIQSSSLKTELTAVVDDYNPNNLQAQRVGHGRAGRLVCVFGGVPLGNVLLPRFDKALTKNGVTQTNKEQALKEWGRKLTNYDLVTASSFINPFDDKEYIFYFNLPFLIQARKLVTPADFIENFRNTWVHERHHFTQYANTQAFIERMNRENGSIETIMLAYAFMGLILPGLTAMKTVEKIADIVEENKHQQISRRGLLKGIAGALGLTAGGVVVSKTYSPIGYNLQYNILPTYENEAVNVASNSSYTMSDLEKTFQINFS